MPFHLIPPEGKSIDVSRGEQAAEAVFVANNSAPEVAVFGVYAAQKLAQRMRCDSLTDEEKQLAEVFSLAWASGPRSVHGKAGG